MKEKKGFLMIPRQLVADLSSKTIKHSDLEVWINLHDLGSYGDWFYLSEKEMTEQCRGKRTTISLSLKRLAEQKHIERRSSGRGLETKLLTRVRDGKVFYKGELKN